MDKNIKGVSILESLVCIVIIGIGFIAMLQLSSYSINAMDRSLEKNKLNFLSEMVLEDMIGDPYNAANYSNFNMTCTYSNPGGSSLSEKKKKEAMLTFSEATEEVISIHSPTWRNQKHAKQFHSTLKTYAFPIIGNKKVSDVTSSDILRILQPIWLSKGETAQRIRQRMSTIFKWAVASELRKDDPTLAIEQALPKQTKN